MNKLSYQLLKTILVSLLFILFSSHSPAQAPTWQWAKSAGTFGDNGPFAWGNQDESINNLKTDKQGNVYAVGWFFSNPHLVNLLPSGNPFAATIGGYGERDAYLIKYSKCGQTLWWRRIGSAGDDVASYIVIDNNQNILIAGGSGGTFTVDGGVPSTTATTQYTVVNNSNAMYIAKFDTTGNFINVNTFPSLPVFTYGSGGGFFIKSNGDYFITTGGSAFVINPVSGVITTTISYMAAAPFLPRIQGVALDKNDNLYLSGSFENIVNIGPGTTLTPSGNPLPPPGAGVPSNYWPSESLLIKFSASGNMLWYKTGNTNLWDALTTCVLDTSKTELVVMGGAQNSSSVQVTTSVMGHSLTINPYKISWIFYRLDANTGNIISSVTTSTPQYQGMISPVHVDKNNIIHCAGRLNGALAFNTATYTSNTGAWYQSCMGKYDIAGNFLGMNMLPQSGSSNTGHLSESINAFDIDEQGNIYIGGMFGGTLDSLGTAVYIHGGTVDGFVAKYGFACGSNNAIFSPVPPSSLSAVYQATLSNHVTWTDNSQYETAYELWCTSGGGTTYSLLATLPANTTNYTHSNVNYNATYCYKARAVNAAGMSIFTNTACVTTPPPPVNAPATPIQLVATNPNAYINFINWTDNSSNEDNFQLWYIKGSNTTYSLLATLPANTTNYTHTFLDYSTVYCYYAVALNSAGSSAFSNINCAATPAAGVGIEELGAGNPNLEIYPNPTTGDVTLRFVSANSQAKIEVLDLTGRLLLSENANFIQGENTRQLSLPQEKGLYIIKLSNDKLSVTKKVSVE